MIESRTASSWWRRRSVRFGALGLAAALAVTGGAIALNRPDVPRGTTVLGIDIGGQSSAEAIKALQAGLVKRADELAKPVPTTVGGQQTQVKPGEVGLAIDVVATVKAAQGGGWRGHVVDPVVTVDATRLDAALKPTVAKAGNAATVPKITYDGLTPKAVYGKPGKGLAAGQAADAFAAQWLRAATVEVGLHEIAPAITNAQLDQVVRTMAKPAVAAPVTATVAGRTLTIAPQDIAKSLTFVDANGTMTPKVDEGQLRSALADQLTAVEVKPRDAKVAKGENGQPQILASTGGKLVDTAALSAELVKVVGQPAPRKILATVKQIAPKTTTAHLENLGIKEQVSTFTTYFQGGEDRNKNILIVADKVDGAIVKPGETFSLNGYTGPRGYAEGYVDAPVILGGKLVKAVGGGISQFTTTLFNASYYAGLQDVFHQPHSYYISRYPSVIEATIYWPSLDMQFRNDSDYGVLIDTSYTEDSITVSMWSTKRYDITTEWGPKRDVTKPKTEVLPAGPECIATGGINGFAQDAWRIFSQNGAEVKREKFSWTYDAEPKFVCGQPKP